MQRYRIQAGASIGAGIEVHEACEEDYTVVARHISSFESIRLGTIIRL